MPKKDFKTLIGEMDDNDSNKILINYVRVFAHELTKLYEDTYKKAEHKKLGQRVDYGVIYDVDIKFLLEGEYTDTNELIKAIQEQQLIYRLKELRDDLYKVFTNSNESKKIFADLPITQLYEDYE